MTTYDNVLANPVDGHAGQAVELAFSVAIVTEFFQKVAGRVEHLNSVIGTVCHLRCTIELCNKEFRLKLSSLSDVRTTIELSGPTATPRGHVNDPASLPRVPNLITTFRFCMY